VEIRFAGLLDENGTVLAGGRKPGMNVRLTQEQLNSVCKELASRVAKRKKFDKELGRVKYSASRREHVVIMSFPIYEKVVMIVAESNVNIDRLAFRVIGKLGSQWGEFVGE
jgi:3-methyladenine DNA glycosylase/8-oxoguanine DNA glycosylase